MTQLKVYTTLALNSKAGNANLGLSQSCAGISFKSQVIYFIVYVTRYLGMPSLGKKLYPLRFLRLGRPLC